MTTQKKYNQKSISLSRTVLKIRTSAKILLMPLLLLFANNCLADDANIKDASNANAIYTKAAEALYKNDCRDAILLLKAYVSAAPATLAQRPNLKAKIDNQIIICQEREKAVCQEIKMLRGDEPCEDELSLSERTKSSSH